ncbi:MAG: hypothetical protein LBO63_08375 [Oscillospiraceae bacterium]|jgi:hypothetical protein|nr:hypothetical protein [Oscillospiraceae bacterium]
MKNNELIKRYIYAVVSHLPQKSQADVERELESIISDTLEARCAGVEPTEADVKAVLTELGDPAELAVKYSGNEGKALLSGIYYLWFKRLIRIVIPIAAIVVALVSAIETLTQLTVPISTSGYISEFVSSTARGGIEGAFQGLIWVLVICVILERKNVKVGSPDFLSKLQAVPDKRARVKIHDPVLSICWNIFAAVLFLGFPYIMGGYSADTGWVSALDTGYIHSVWYLVVILSAIGIGKEIFRLYERRYSRRLAAVTVGANLLTVLFAGVFLLNPAIVNPAFVDRFTLIFEENVVFATNLNVILFGIVVFALLLETGTTLYRALRYDR